MENNFQKELSKKLDALILLNVLEDLSSEEKIKILKNSVTINKAASLLEKDPSNFSFNLRIKTNSRPNSGSFNQSHNIYS